MARLRAVVVFVARSSRRLAVTVVGATLVLAGLAGIVLPVLPGPLLVIAGLAVLASEYVWARRALDAARRRAVQARASIRKRRSDRAAPNDRSPGEGTEAGPDGPSPGRDGNA